MALEVIILAAGQGTRMRSKQPKVLHTVGGRPMLARVIDTASELSPSRVHVVIGAGGEQVKGEIARLYEGSNVQPGFAEQSQQLGTGHAVQQAVQQAAPPIPGDSYCLILNGDAPLLDLASLEKLREQVESSGAALGILTATPADPTGLGRIIRDASDQVTGIVEQKDATPEQQKIPEINSGIMYCRADALARWLDNLGNENSQGEYYLTDIVSLAVTEGARVEGVLAVDPGLLVGVNSRTELASAERILQRQTAQQLLEAGVTIRDPDRLDVRGTLQHGVDCTLDINVVIEGDVSIGDNVHIGPGCVIRNVTIGDNCRIESYSVLEQATLGNGCNIGPYARLRPGASLGDAVRVGNFVEIKNSQFGTGSKANHLAYVGDSMVGSGVNIGAGVITANYDGANKHQTTIGDEVFVGSNSVVVAPVTIGSGSTIGAGTTLTRDVPEKHLAITRAAHRAIADWPRPVKK